MAGCGRAGRVVRRRPRARRRRRPATSERVGLVVDTSAFVAVERSARAWDQALDPLAQEPAVIPAIVYTELLVGGQLAGNRARAASRRAKIEAFLARVPVVEFDTEVAER